ncbi:MAG: uracil phosphoribosyltransferase [Thermoanaerobaculia bacterium]|nr:uracil phosphoribosyltransferase [Thermoanaerobaculia bacterium]
MTGRVLVVDHPLVQHKLSLMRRDNTTTQLFRTLLREVSSFLAYEATRDLPVIAERVKTPLAEMEGVQIEGKKVVIAPVLRAGLGMLDGFLDLIPAARVGHVGMYRDEETLEPVEYYFKMPGGMTERDVMVVDPMLATGNTAAAAVGRILLEAPRSIRLICLLAAPEGIENFHAQFPQVDIVTAAIDDHLNDKGYIVPGLGDAGDRMFGTC